MVGTKTDLRNNNNNSNNNNNYIQGAQKKRMVSEEEGKSMAKKLKAVGYLECSAINCEGIEQVFEAAATQVVLRGAPGGTGGGTCCTLS